MRVAETPGLPITDVRDLLAQSLGDNLQVRVLGGRVIVIDGNVPDDATLKSVQAIIDAVAPKAAVTNLARIVEPAKRQVLVHVRVLDVRKTALEHLGVQWGESSDTGDLSSVTQSWLFGFNHNDPTSPFEVNALGARLNLLMQNNDVRELATPNILVNDGEEANILVGGEIPIPVPQASSSGTGGGLTITITYKQFGVLLRFKPVIINDRIVRLTMAPEVSDIDKSTSVTVSGFSIPGFVTRRETTTTDMLSGDTLAVGGLLQNTTTTVVNKIPILGDIPILGQFFRNKEFTQGKTELVILVTPEIISTTDRMHVTAAGGAGPVTGTEGH